MKIIKTLYIPLFLLVLLSSVFVNLGSAETLPAFKVEPTNTLMKPAGQSFEVDVYAYDTDYESATDVYAWQVCMKWDPAVVDIDDTVIFGDFMDAPRVGPWGALTEDALAGEYIVYVADGSKFDSGVAVLIEDSSNSEENEVASASGSQLTMKYALAHTYTVAANGGAYPIPDLTPATSISHTAGRIITGQGTMGAAPGAQGNGLLCTLTFHILTEAETALDIDNPVYGEYTFIINHLGEALGDEASGAGDPGNWQSELLKGSGHLIFPWAEDLNGDGTVDIFDLCSVALHFGEISDIPGWIPEDVNSDGVVNVEDLTLVSVKYGIYAGA